jgi:prephenate dehydrogenase
MKEVAVFGVGLIGGSIALALRESTPKLKISVIDRGPVLDEVRARSLADQVVPTSDRALLKGVVERADLTVLACPVRVIVAELPQLLDWCRMLTDCGSTKREIVAAAQLATRREQFVAGHPMAGGPQGGLANARADLFRGQSWLLCSEGSALEAVRTVEELVATLGARAVHMSAEAHDRSVARTSHVPQILASALAVLVDDSDAAAAAGPGFRSATRPGGGEEAMWRDIFASNGDEVASALSALLSRLELVRDELAEQPAKLEAVLQLLSQARAARART